MKTTKKDFDYFKVQCLKWQNKLGIINWAVHFDHKSLEDVYAKTAWKTQDMMAVVQLNTTWDKLRPKNNKELDRLALHEMMHVLLAPLVSEAEWRYASQDGIDTAEHSIVRSLENILVDVDA